MVHVDHCIGEALQLSAAWSFHDDLHARFPALLAPCFNPEDMDAHLVLDELPHPPKRPAPLLVQSAPVCAELPSCPPLHHQGIQQLPEQPDLG